MSGEESQARTEEDRAAADTIDQLNHSHHERSPCSESACADDSQPEGVYGSPPPQADILAEQYTPTPAASEYLHRAAGDVCDLRVTDAQAQSMQREYLEGDRRDEDTMILPGQYRRDPYQFTGMFPHVKGFPEEQYHLQQFALQGYHEKVEEREDQENRYDDILVLGEKGRSLDVCSNASGRSSEGLEHGTPPGLEYPETKEGLLDLHLPQGTREIPNNSFVHLAAALHSPSSTPSQDQEEYGSAEGLHRLQPAYPPHPHPHSHQQEVIQHSNNYQT